MQSIKNSKVRWEKIFVKILHKMNLVCYNLKSCKNFIIGLTNIIVIKNSEDNLYKNLRWFLAQFESNRSKIEPA